MLIRRSPELAHAEVTPNQSLPYGSLTAPWREAIAYDMLKTTADATKIVEGAVARMDVLLVL